MPWMTISKQTQMSNSMFRLSSMKILIQIADICGILQALKLIFKSSLTYKTLISGPTDSDVILSPNSTR